MIKVYATPYIMNHARKLSDILTSLGYQSCVVTHVDPSDNDLYILYSSFLIKQLPKRYIVYQVEQWGNRFFTSSYWKQMQHAVAVWEWSENNLVKYGPEFKGKVFFVPPGLVDSPAFGQREIDRLFYGAMNGHRRQWLSEIESKSPVYKVHNVFADKMLEILSRTTFVINIHYYASALEAFRINEALCCGCIVVSEMNKNLFYPDKYSSLVNYASTPETMWIMATGTCPITKIEDLSILDNSSFIKNAIYEKS